MGWLLSTFWNLLGMGGSVDEPEPAAPPDTLSFTLSVCTSKSFTLSVCTSKSFTL